MADIDLISEFSGITITSDQTTGTNNPNATFAVPSVTTAQRANLQNVTPYVVGDNTYKVKPGTIIYNITTKSMEAFIDNNWGVLTFSTNIRTGTLAIGDIGTGAIGPVVVTGAILTGNRTVAAANASTFTLTYADLGYIPICFITIIDTNSILTIYTPVISTVPTATGFTFKIQDTGGGQAAVANILLVKP